MSNLFRKMACSALAFGLATAVAAQDADTVVATVNGTDITVGQMIMARTNLPQQYAQYPDNVLFPGILDQLIQQTLLAQTLTDDVPARVAIAVANEERSQLAEVAVERVIDEMVSEDIVQAAYDAKYAGFEGAPEFDASHILVETEEEALALVEELNGGADFAELAKEHSTGPSGPGGGALGWFGQGQMVKPFEDAVLTLEVGGVSAPVQTQFGWHIVKLNDSRTTEVPTLESVRGELEVEVRQQVLTAALEDLQAAAEIDRTAADAMDPSVIGNIGLLYPNMDQ